MVNQRRPSLDASGDDGQLAIGRARTSRAALSAVGARARERTKADRPARMGGKRPGREERWRMARGRRAVKDRPVLLKDVHVRSVVLLRSSAGPSGV